MLRSAPKFYEVAKRIIEITEGCILVAHNASFDYRILRTEFNRLGYDFKVPTLCTVELSKKLILDQPSYSLGKLVRRVQINRNAQINISELGNGIYFYSISDEKRTQNGKIVKN